MAKELRLFLALSFLIFTADLLSQDNYNYENFGNRSILLNGNVTGSVNDLGATFYNPARLSQIEDLAFTINAKVYEYSQLTIEDFLGQEGKLDDSNFNGLPSMVAGTFKLKFMEGSTLAYSFISRRRTESNLNYDSGLIDTDIESIPGMEQFTGRINLRTKDKDEWIGLSWSKKFGENFSLGASGFYSAFESRGSSAIRYVALTEEKDVTIYNSEIAFEQSAHGLFFKAGAAWSWEKLDLGINVDFPYISVLNEGSFRYEEFLGGAAVDETNAIFTLNDLSDLDANRKVPFGISAGAGFHIGRSTLHANLSWWSGQNEFETIEIRGLESETSELPNLELVESYKSVFNFGLGAEVYVTEKSIFMPLMPETIHPLSE